MNWISNPSITLKSRWKSTPVTPPSSSLTTFRNRTKIAQNEVKSLTSRIAYINRHFQQVEKQKLKVFNSTRNQQYFPLLSPKEQKFINPLVCNYMKAKQVKKMKAKNNALLEKNKQNIKLSNLVKRYNVNLHKQNAKQSVLKCQIMKQENANTLRKEKFYKLMKLRKDQQRLKYQLIEQQSIALERLDSLLNEQVKMQQDHKGSLYITQL